MDARKDDIEKRLMQIREEREREVSAVDRVSLRGVDIAVGSSVHIKSDAAVFHQSEQHLPVKDVTKTIYLGEAGRVRSICQDYYGKGLAFDVIFLDGVSKMFYGDCIDVGPSSSGATRGVAIVSSVARKPTTNLPADAVIPAVHLPHDAPVSAPDWSALRRPGSTRSAQVTASPAVTSDKTTVSPAIVVGPRKSGPTTPVELPVVPAEPAPLPSEAIDEPRRAFVPTLALEEPLGSAACPRVHMAVEPAVSSAAPALSVHVTPRAVGVHDDEDDNLLCTPRGLARMSLENTLSAPQVERPLSGRSAVVETLIPSCPQRYTPVFPLSDPKSRIPRAPASTSSGVKHCTIVAAEDFVGKSSVAVRAATQSIAFRSHQNTMESVLAACTNQLDWGRLGKRVERLFLASGAEVLWTDAIADGAVLVATPGGDYHPPPIVRSSSASRPERRSTSPSAPRPVLSLVNAAKPIAVKIFVNGEYGDIHSEPIPYKTITIRPTYKTLVALYTLIGRELQWNALGRRVEVLYTCRGEEVRGLDMIRDGDSLVASSGDRFIVPRVTSVLHHEVQSAKDERVGNRSPARHRSPVRASLGAGSVPSTAQTRAAALLTQINREHLRAARRQS